MDLDHIDDRDHSTACNSRCKSRAIDRGRSRCWRGEVGLGFLGRCRLTRIGFGGRDRRRFLCSRRRHRMGLEVGRRGVVVLHEKL